jgi:hypothetical protein
VVAADLGSGGFLERIDRLGVMVVQYLGNHPHSARLAMREMVDGGPFWAASGRQRVERAMRAVVRFLAAGMAEGAIPAQDPAHLAVSIIGVHLFPFAASDVSGAVFDSDPFARAAIDERAAAVVAQVRRLCGAPAA